MTIAAQHVRAAINHLRGLDPRWRDIIRQVGPFAVRLERAPAAWLIQHLHADSLLDILSNPTPSTDGAQPSLTDGQRRFAAELRSLLQHGRLDLSPPLPPADWADRSAPLTELLDRHHSPLLPHFLFFCWGQLDHWPMEDRELSRYVHQLWPTAKPLPRGAHDSTCSASAPSDNRNWPVDTWAPFRSVAAWYLARWSMEQMRTASHAKPGSE